MHRFGLNVTEAIAAEIAGFFFPNSDEEIVRKREEVWAKFAEGHHDDLESESSDKGALHSNSLPLNTLLEQPTRIQAILLHWLSHLLLNTTQACLSS